MSYILLSVLLLLSPGTRASYHIAGDYAGWAFIDGGGDLPFRLHITTAGDDLSVTFDLPSQGNYARPTVNASFESDELRFETTTSRGDPWTFRATLNGDVLTGESQLGSGTRLEFDLTRADFPLRSPAPTIDAADYTGTYRSENGSAIVITAWFWNELRYAEPDTGRVGTLFSLSTQDFFAGSAEYIPAPVSAHYTFELDDHSAAVSLFRTEPGGPTTAFTRLKSREEPITFHNGDVTLHGTLLLPPGDGPHPAIVAVGGSDWRTRNAVRREADIFTSFGLATLIFDKRGQGDSSGDPICSFADVAADMAAAADLLHARDDIRGDAVGVFGRSRGGWFAPLAAANHPEIDFVIVLVAPAVSPAQQETTRRMNEFRAAGHTPEELDEAQRYLDLLWASLDTDESWQRYVSARDDIEARGWGDILGGLAAPDTDDARWNRLNMQYDPIPALQGITCPILVLFGEADANVTPEQNLEPFRDALLRGGNDDATVLVLPRADHGLRPALPDTPPPPMHRSTGYVPEVWSTVRQWLTDRKFIGNE